MRILGIETSCDETAAAILENGTKILSNVVASSVELHKKTGGVIPEVAAREQVRCIIPVVNETMKQLSHEAIEAIAVTIGPGLIGSLLVGVETARTLSFIWQKPIIPINHLQAHLYANFIREIPNSKFQIPNFPAIGLVVSGGHTDLVLMKGHGKLKWLGGTRDDAAGECFDKCARILGLGYPGGPAIEKAAKSCLERDLAKEDFTLPRPMIKQKNYDFSFSGLKTAVLYQTRKPTPLIAREIQEAIVDVLVKKTVRAAREFKARSILLSGGVAANTLLRKTLEAKSKKLKVKFFVPPKNLCLDNAAMVASCAYFNLKPTPWEKIQANPSLTITGGV